MQEQRKETTEVTPWRRIAPAAQKLVKRKEEKLEPSSVPPSWEVLDEEARALGLEVTSEIDQDTGQGYVAYTGNGLQVSFLDDSTGRESANARLERLANEW